MSSSTAAYEPHGGALKLMRCRDAEVLLEGPAGTGKSRSCLEKLHLCALKYPGMRGLIARKTRESMSESVLVTFETKVLPPNSPIKDGPSRRMRQIYTYPNGSELVIAGLDKPSKIMSTEYDMAYIPEATEATENDVESVTTRLRNGVMPYQQLIMDANPDAPTHFLNQRCEKGLTTRILSRHEDNPTINEAYLDKLRALTGVRRARLFEGRWAAAEGLIYQFDRAVHLLDRFEIPQEWRRIRAIDFGYTNPFVCQWWAIDGDGRMYLYREMYMSQRLVSDHAAQIKALTGDEVIEANVADHDAEDRATLERCGIPTLSATKEVGVGIQAVQERLRPAGDGRPRLFVLRDSLVEPDEELIEAKRPFATEQEFDGYVWAKGADGKPVKEEPVKLNDHGMDTMRYAVRYVDSPNVARSVQAGVAQRRRRGYRP